MPETRIAVLVSGSGTLLEAMLREGVPIKLVLADRECRGIDIAREYAAERGIEVVVVDRRGYDYGSSQNWDREGFSSDIASMLKYFRIDVAAMAGFMTIFDPVIFTFGGWLLNIHPSLLPAFKGEHAVRDALLAGVTETGTTIHVATEELDDHRFIIAQVTVTVESGDDVASLHERIKIVERELFVATLFAILRGRLDLQEIFPLERNMA